MIFGLKKAHIMKIYTKGGDFGETNLCGGPRITKSHLRIEAYGSIDELNAVLGFAQAEWKKSEQVVDTDKAQVDLIFQQLSTIQQELFVVGAHLATQYDLKAIPGSVPAFPEAALERIEIAIDQMDKDLPELKDFVMPAGTATACALHMARTVCRRAERAVVRLSHEEEILPQIIQYLNRLSDFLFVAARVVNHATDQKEELWQKE